MTSGPRLSSVIYRAGSVAAPATLVGQELEQQGPDPKALIGVVYNEGDFADVRPGHPVVLGYADELGRPLGHQSQMVRALLLDEPRQFVGVRSVWAPK